MTTIKSTHLDSDAVNITLGRGGGHHSCPPEGEVWLDVTRRDRVGRVNANIPLSDLLDALGAVSTADMAKEIGEEVARRKAAEAEALEQAKLVRTFADRGDEYREKLDKAEQSITRLTAEADASVAEARNIAETYQAKYHAEQTAHAATRKRAEAAEADRDRLQGIVDKVQGILDRADPAGESVDLIDDLRNAINHEPPFTLPTESGVRFECRNDYRGTVAFRSLRDGAYGYKYLYEGKNGL